MKKLGFLSCIQTTTLKVEYIFYTPLLLFNAACLLGTGSVPFSE